MENIANGSVIGYKYFDFKGLTKITIRTRAYFHGKFQIMTKWDGEPFAEISCESTNIWWDYSADVAVPDGVSALYLKYVGGGNPQLWGIILE